MMRRLPIAVIWILSGSAITGGVYWGLLNTPESSAGSLMMSALLALLSLALAAITVNGAIAIWNGGWSRTVIRHAAANAPAILPALAIILVLWWVVARATGWASAHNGEINAWFIAKFGWDDVSWLFTSITWIARWLRWILAPTLALALLGAISVRGWAAAFGLGWIRSALSPLRLALVTVWFGVLIAAPWIYLAPWHPRGLPATSVEMAFIAAKLTVVAILMSIGAALVVRSAVHQRAPLAP